MQEKQWLWFSLAFWRCLTLLQWKMTSGSYYKGCVKLFWKLLTNYCSVIHWLGFGTYWVRICKIFPKYSSSSCVHAWGRWCDSKRFTGDTKLGKATILEGRIRAQKICWHLGEGSEKAGWNIIGIGMISYLCDRTTTCTNTGWKINGKAVIIQRIWSSDSGCHLMWGTEFRCEFSKRKANTAGSV